MTEDIKIDLAGSIGEIMRRDCIRARQELESTHLEEHERHDDDDASLQSSLSSGDHSIDKEGSGIRLTVHMSSQDSLPSVDSSMIYNNDYTKLSQGLQKRAENFGNGSYNIIQRDSASSGADLSHDEVDDSLDEPFKKKERRRSSRDRNVNRQLHRLYKGRAFTAGLVFSKGHFLGDISKMVAGLLSSTYQGKDNGLDVDDNSANYGFGEKNEGGKSFGGRVGELTIHEQEGDQHIVHSSTLVAGKDGCVVLVFPKPSLILFLDEYPGLLLSLLGTQVVL